MKRTLVLKNLLINSKILRDIEKGILTIAFILIFSYTQYLAGSK